MSALKTLFLRDPPLTLAAAESLTCGHVQAQVGAISGASLFFLGGITAYTLDEKVRHLGVDRDTAASVNSVSDAVARQMARGACELFGSDYGVATTGYAEPVPAEGVATPFACWAVARRGKDGAYDYRSGRIVCAGLARTRVQAVVARAVLAELRAAVLAERGGAVNADGADSG